MKHAVNLSILIALLPGSLFCQGDRDDYLLGLARISEGRYQEADANLTDAISKNQNRNEYYLKRAECRYELGDYSGALNDLKNIDNKDIGSLLAARCYARTGNTEQCLAYLEKHLRSVYKLPESVLLLDPAFTGLENLSQWRSLWRNEWYTDDERFLAEVTYLIRKKNYLDALEQLSQGAEAASPGHALLALRAEAFFGLGNLNNCITDLTAAIEKNGTIPSYFNRRAEAYNRQGKYLKAVQDYSRSLQLDPDQFDIYFARAKAYKAMDDLNSACDDMEFLVRYYPDSEKFLYDAGRMDYLNKSYINALKHLNSLLKISTDSAGYFQARGETYLATNIYRYAAMDFSMALDLDPYNSECYLKKGLARFHLGDTKGACSDWNKARQYGSAEAVSLLSRYCK